MLLAYIDEIGETGAFVSRDHLRFRTSPAFGYGGFVIPEGAARAFGAIFTEHKRTLFARDIGRAEHPARWERKGSEIFNATAPEDHPEQLRVFDALVRRLRALGGSLFYYADEKPIGTPKQTSLDTDARERAAMRESLNRLARHADTLDQNLLVMIDQINEKTRAARLPEMYSHILGRAADFREMHRILEPPMHIDSRLSSNIQFADWVAACVGRAIDYQLVEASRYRWIVERHRLKQVRGAFTHDSKLHLCARGVDHFHHSEVFAPERRLHPEVAGQRLGASLDPRAAEKMRAMAARRLN